MILEPKNTTDLLHHCACGQARRAFLQQDNELAEMRQRLQEHTHHLGGLKVRTNKSSDDVEGKRQQLCVKIRTLSVASKTLGTARNKLEVFHVYISFPSSTLIALPVPTPKRYRIGTAASSFLQKILSANKR